MKVRKTRECPKYSGMQKSDANANFCKFIEEEYEEWLNDPRSNKPILSHQLMKQKVFPHLKGSGEPLFFLLIDNFRFDQWKMIQPILQEYFNIEEESSYYSILPNYDRVCKKRHFLWFDAK